ncbi:hypothetical protein BHE74_00001609 [Ensete ventricosum]|nr:hypothetical protein BHE74_00001609 [Ensete ventricosum]
MCPDLCCPPSMVSIRHHSPLPNVVDEEKPRRRSMYRRLRPSLLATGRYQPGYSEKEGEEARKKKEKEGDICSQRTSGQCRGLGEPHEAMTSLPRSFPHLRRRGKEEVSRFQIARRLLGKILIDLRNTREEAISVAELKSSQEPTSMFAKTRKEETEYQVRSLNKNEDPRRSSTTSEKSLDQDDDDDRETKYRLDPKFLS